MFAWTWRRSTVAVALASACSGCGGAAFTDAPSSDGGVESASEASTEGGVAEGGGGSDAAVDSFCAMTTLAHIFCDDFDDRSGNDAMTVQGGWSSEALSPDSQLSIDRMAVGTPSAPNSLLAQVVGPVTTPTMVHALLSDAITQSAPTGRLQTYFDVNVESYGGDGSTNDLAALYVVSLGPLTYELVVTDAMHAYFVESLANDAGAPATHTLAGSYTPMVWTNTSILLRAPTAIAAGHVTITFTVANQAVVTVLDEDLVERAAVAGAPLSVYLGIGTQLAASSWAVRYDNVLLNTL